MTESFRVIHNLTGQDITEIVINGGDIDLSDIRIVVFYNSVANYELNMADMSTTYL